MNEELKRDILSKIDQILNQMDLTKLYPNHPNVQQWSNLDRAETEQLVKLSTGLLRKVSENSVVIDSVSPLDIKNLDNHLNDFIRFYNNNNLPSLNEAQITNQHHEALTRLSSLISIIKNSGIYTDLNTEILLKQKIDDLTKAETLVNLLLPNTENIRSATESASKWLNVRREVNGKTIEEQAEAFHDMAQEHKAVRGWLVKNPPTRYWEKFGRVFVQYDCFGSWLWLLLAFVFAVATGLITYELIIKAATGSKEILLGGALLRVASLAVPAYLTLFSANQFLYHQRLYNNYKFKYSSMSTMNHLIATHQERGEKILEKGLDILFSEPRTKEVSGKYDTQIVNELVKLLREQINK